MLMTGWLKYKDSFSKNQFFGVNPGADWYDTSGIQNLIDVDNFHLSFGYFWHELFEWTIGKPFDFVQNFRRHAPI